MALKSTHNFILHGNYRSQLFSVLCRPNKHLRILNHMYSTESRGCKPCAQIIISCYQRKNFHCIKQHEKSLKERESYNPPYRVVLSASPDEFEKLPPKCSACGTILQTKQSNERGFVNEIKFMECFQNNTLDRLVCFNCYRLRYHNSSVLPRINPAEAMDQLRFLRQRKALILYVVDMFDIEGTILRNLLQLVGSKKRMIIVGNKIDRLPQDSKKPAEQLETMKDVLKEICFQNGLEKCNFRDICLVSARTGFGLKTLVQKIVKHRDVDMDVYLVGCANTGKSTLYNFLVNILNVHKSGELPAQAITHHTPGTTHSLVRQGISKRRLERLVKRMTSGPWEEETVFNFDDELLDLVGVNNDDPRYGSLEKASKNTKDGWKLLEERRGMLKPRQLEVVEYEKDGIKPCFIYDTPGILNNSQLVHYLTPSEINYLSPTRWIVPRTFILTPGNCLFVGGLARLDYLNIKRTHDNEEGQHKESESYEGMHKAAESIYITAMVSPNVPIHVTISETADEKFKKLFSDDFFKIPKGSTERLNSFPKLLSTEYTIMGKSRNVNACDFALHGVGWLSVAAVSEALVNLALYTPNGEGQGLRLKPLLPYTVQKKIGRGLPYYGHLNRYMYGHSRKRSPQFVRVFQQQNDTVYSWNTKIKQKMKQERFQRKETKRLERLEQGIFLGRMKNLKEKEEKFKLIEEQNYMRLLEKGK